MQPGKSFLTSPVFSVEHARSSACFARPFEMIRLRNVRAAACDAYWSGYIIGLTWNVRSDDPIDASKILIRSFFVASLDASSIVLDEDEGTVIYGTFFIISVLTLSTNKHRVRDCLFI